MGARLGIVDRVCFDPQAAQGAAEGLAVCLQLVATSRGGHMQRAQKICYVVGALFATPTLIGTAAAQGTQHEGKPSPSKEKQPTPVEITAAKVSARATVAKIDQPNRQLVLQDHQGNRFKVDVPEDVSRFDAIKKGDTIAVDYYTSVALALKKGGSGQPPSAGEETAVERTPGPLPGGMTARRIDASVEVVKVDTAAHKLTLKTPSGDVDTIEVTDPDLRKDLAKLEPGDKIRAVYTEAVAIAVAPKPRAG
jgi:hypothetical protein